MTVIERFEQECLEQSEKIAFKDLVRLGKKDFLGLMYNFGYYESTVYVTNKRVAVVTPKPPFWLKLIYKSMIVLAGSVNDDPGFKAGAKQAVKLNPNEGNVLNVPLHEIEVEFVTKVLWIIPESVVVLKFSDGSILPITPNAYTMEVGIGCDSLEIRGRAKALFNAINFQKVSNLRS